MANVHVDYAELGATASRLSSGREELVAQLTALQAVVASLVSSGFVTDRASGTFKESYDQWTTGARTVVEGLSGMSAFLNKAVAEHQSLDAQLSVA